MEMLSYSDVFTEFNPDDLSAFAEVRSSGHTADAFVPISSRGGESTAGAKEDKIRLVFRETSDSIPRTLAATCY